MGRLALLVLVFGLLAPGAQAAPPTASELLAKNASARGRICRPAEALKAASREPPLLPPEGSGDTEEDAPGGASGSKGMDKDAVVEETTLPTGWMPWR